MFSANLVPARKLGLKARRLIMLLRETLERPSPQASIVPHGPATVDFGARISTEFRRYAETFTDSCASWRAICDAHALWRLHTCADDAIQFSGAGAGSIPSARRSFSGSGPGTQQQRPVIRHDIRRRVGVGHSVRVDATYRIGWRLDHKPDLRLQRRLRRGESASVTGLQPAWGPLWHHGTRRS